MDLKLYSNSTYNYNSKSQQARVLTEAWVGKNMFCPRCGNITLEHFKNNSPVADFFCPCCNNQYELKSKTGKLGVKITDGAYSSMIERINSNENPDLFLMSYSAKELSVLDFWIVPKYFFVPDIIEKRNPLSSTAKRSGWVGCNILIGKIPEQGRIRIINNGQVESIKNITFKMQLANKLKTDNVAQRGWLLDILNCVNSIEPHEFELGDVYRFENRLAEKHPDNNNIRPKIRQQLHILRDKGVIEFIGNGKYRKIPQNNE